MDKVEKRKQINDLRDKIKNKAKEIEIFTEELKQKLSETSVSKELSEVKKKVVKK